MKKIKKYLSQWISKGLITSEQEQKIIEYEETKNKDNKSKWVLYGFLILGVTVVGIGIISLVAANWDKIPGIVKLINMLFILCGIAFVILKLDNNEKQIVFDAVSALFIFLCLSAIGLISQVFHTGGELYQALLVWVIITFSLGLLGKKDFLPALWVGGFILMFLAWSFSSHSWWYHLDNRIDDDNVFTVFLTLPLLALFLGELMVRFELLRRHGNFFKIVAILSVFVAFITADIHFSAGMFKYVIGAFVPVYIFGTASLILIFYKSGFSRKEKIILSIIIGVTVFIFVPHFFGGKIDHGNRKFGELVGALYHITMLILLSIIFIIKNNKKLFNIITLLVGVRFLVVYFQVFGDLATTGFGLIISGLIIIGVAVLWFKKMDKIENWLGDVIK